MIRGGHPSISVDVVVDGISITAEIIITDLNQRLLKQRKTQREKLGLLIAIATMLDVCSANLMDLAAGLAIATDRTGLERQRRRRYMRYQWIIRFLINFLMNPRVDCDASWRPLPAKRWSGRQPAATRWS